ncbi:hypothetical protein L195_g023263 [Trifolium pratense]|uniref:DUF4219 domain-containing protein n=1 Tax=Trifolium pratense TaxID=57577 RepID=A0A2K3NAE2_TRIPR|nr:hypothetical protein L195_g023263 [Trifolium pratense]
MSSNPNGHFPMNLPILSNNNYDNWCKQMKVVFRFQEMWNLVTEDVPTIDARATDEEKTTNKELKKRDFKALFIIHQCVDATILRRFLGELGTSVVQSSTAE